VLALVLAVPLAAGAAEPEAIRLERLMVTRRQGQDVSTPGRGEHRMRVLAVTPQGAPAPGIVVRFELIAAPKGAGRVELSPVQAHTDSQGIAETTVRLPAQAGAYGIGAIPTGAPAHQAPVIGEFRVRDAQWWSWLAMGLAGGLAVFLYGMGLMSEGLKNVLGDRMRTILSRLTFNPLIAAAVGTFLTMVIQSSSATTVMLVSFVQARLMSFVQTLGIILGAHIGTTITAQIIAFKITDSALLFVVAGFALMLLSRGEWWKHLGQGVLGFGLLFFGMYLMSEAIRPLSAYEPLIDLIVTLERPWLGILAGIVLTAVIQSSSAFTGLLIVLGSQGLLTLEAAIPLVLGANIGTSITAALASIGARRDAKRVALAHALYQIAGVLIFLWFIPAFAGLVRWISPALAPGQAGLATAAAAVVPRQIANAHTLFNTFITLLFLPFTRPTARAVTWLLPDRPGEAEAPFKAVYLDDAMLRTPALALSLARAEAVRMGQRVKRMVERCAEPFVAARYVTQAEMASMEEEVNFLAERIDDYLTRLGQRNVTQQQVDEAFQLLYAVTELEQIADIVTKSVQPRAREWLSLPRRFSAQGEAEIRDMHLRTVKQVARAVNLLQDLSPERAQRMRRKYKKYRSMEIEFMKSHFERLRKAVPESVATTEFHQELMEQFVRITGHATNIARIMLEAVSEERAAQAPPPPDGGAAPPAPGRELEAPAPQPETPADPAAGGG
jgi:phosphate:Na+ symporter